jgi:hypothetical protein
MSYVFDDSGRFLGSFAKQGTAEGELSHYLNRFLAGRKIVLATPEHLQFYSEDGVFLTSYENNIFARFPLVFVNEREFIYAPNLPQSPVNQKNLRQFNLETGEDELVADFAQSEDKEKSHGPSPMIMIFGLTPQVRLSVCGNRMYFGRSDQYTLYAADLQGNIDFSFSLNRPKKAVTVEDKKRHFQGSRIPQDRIDSLIKQLPDKTTYFSQIDAVDALIYVYAVSNIKRTQAQQNFDIFSDEGKYLYQGFLKFGDDVEFGSPSNLAFHNDHVYVILESQEGTQSLAKYKIIHPELQH